MWSNYSSSPMTWGDCARYCANLVEGGFSDWRMPTLKEAIELATKVDAGTNTNYFWTATPLGDDGITQTALGHYGITTGSTGLYYGYEQRVNSGSQIASVTGYSSFTFRGFYYTWMPSTGEWTWYSATTNTSVYCRCVR